MKIIIVSLQVCESASKGHLHPAIELAQAAINRQHDVSILPLPSNLGINDQQQINKLNINYIAPPKLPWKIEQSKLAQLAKDANTAHLAYKLFMFDPIEHQIKEINKIFNDINPDIILCDSLVFSAALSAHQLNIPCYSFCAGLKMATNEKDLPFYANCNKKLSEPVEKIESNGVKIRNLEFISGYGNFVFFPKELSEYFSNNDIDYVGSLPISDRKDYDETATFKIPKNEFAVLSFGSVQDPYDFPGVTNEIIKATQYLDMKLMISSVKYKKHNNILPDHVTAYEYIPFKGVIDKATVFFHHGGANSFSEALRLGAKQILIPLAIDQPLQALLLKKMECGFTCLPGSFSCEFAINAISSFKKDHALLKNIETIKEEYNKASGSVNVIKYIENNCYLKNIYNAKRKIKEVLYPKSEDEIKQIIINANKYGFTVYPVSGGKNYGLGSNLPVMDVDYIIDLRYLNKIDNYIKSTGVITIEAGVTQEQLYEYLNNSGSEHVLDVTGSTADSSIVGNMVERGVAHYAERESTLISLRCILGNGDVINSGSSSIQNFKSKYNYALGLGPDLKGLFFQSSFSIVTKVTIQLRRYNPNTFVANLALKKNIRKSYLMDKLIKLKENNIITNNLHLSNIHRKYSLLRTLYQTKLNLTAKDAEMLFYDHCEGDFFATISFDIDRRMIDTTKRILQEDLNDIANVSYVDNNTYAEATQITLATRGIFNHSLGIPSNDSIYSLGAEQEELIDPKKINYGQVGTLFLVPVIPFTNHDIDKALDIINKNFYDNGFKPYITFNLIRHNNLEGVINLLFNNTCAKSVALAEDTISCTFNELIENEYFPMRLSIFQMNQFKLHLDEYKDILSKLKHLFDPNNVIAPGRYEFWSRDHKIKHIDT